MTRQAVQYRFTDRKIGEFAVLFICVGMYLYHLSYLAPQALSRPEQTTYGTHVTHNCTHHIVVNTINDNDSYAPFNPTSATTEPPISYATETLADDIGSMPFWMWFGGPEPPDWCGSQLSPYTIAHQPYDLRKLEERLGDKLETFQEPGVIMRGLFRILLDPGVFPSPPSSMTVSGRLSAEDYAKTESSYTNMVRTYAMTKRNIMATHINAVCSILKKDSAQGVVKNFEADTLRTMSYVGAFDEDTLVAISSLPGVAKIAYVRADGKRR